MQIDILTDPKDFLLDKVLKNSGNILSKQDIETLSLLKGRKS